MSALATPDPRDITDRLTEAADERSGTMPPYWAAVPRDMLREARDEIARLRGEMAEAIEEVARIRTHQHDLIDNRDMWHECADRAETERDALRAEVDELRADPPHADTEACAEADAERDALRRALRGMLRYVPCCKYPATTGRDGNGLFSHRYGESPYYTRVCSVQDVRALLASSSASVGRD